MVVLQWLRKNFSNLPFPIVDIARQNTFAEFVKQVDKSKFVVSLA